MPKTLIQGKNMYYEIHGEGEPLVLLNGIMMSTASWTPFIEVFSKNNKLVLVDFVDQGKSDKMAEEYPQDLHVEMINELFQVLQLGKVHVIGISYGGEIAQKYALKYQENLLSLTLANTTSHTKPILKDIGDSWANAARTYDGSIFFKANMPYIYSSEFYDENLEWLLDREKAFSIALTPDWYEAFIRLIKSAEDLNITNELKRIKVPTIIIGSEFDAVTPLRYQSDIHREIVGSKMVTINNCGHASMYEKPQEFASIILGFINIYNTKIEVL